VDSRLLDIIACPICKSKLRFDKTNQELLCRLDALAYPIRNDIPMMIEDQARQLSQDEVDKWRSV
jgi:uncharacterized protein